MKKEILYDADVVHEKFNDMLDGTVKGTIPLAVPVANINEWSGSVPSFCSVLTGLSKEDMENILYYRRYVLFRADGAYRLADEKEYLAAAEEEEKPLALAGAEALERILRSFDKKTLFEIGKSAEEKERKYMEAIYELQEKNRENREPEEDGGGEPAEDPADGGENGPDEDELRLKELYRGLRETRTRMMAARHFFEYGTSRLIFRKIDLFPLQIRTLLSENKKILPYAVYGDICRLYARIVDRNRRLEKLRDLGAPEIILRNESRMLQEHVDALIHNERRENPDLADDGTPLVSLSGLALGNLF